VLLIQIRAYPELAPEVPRAGPWSLPLRWLGDGMQWLTTPLEGLSAVGRRVMIDRNTDLVEDLRRAFTPRRPAVPFETAELECPESAALSWYLTEEDRKKPEWQARPKLPPVSSVADVGRGSGTTTAADK
jgi:hypothetical protein